MLARSWEASGSGRLRRSCPGGPIESVASASPSSHPATRPWTRPGPRVKGQRAGGGGRAAPDSETWGAASTPDERTRGKWTVAHETQWGITSSFQPVLGHGVRAVTFAVYQMGKRARGETGFSASPGNTGGFYFLHYPLLEFSVCGW